MMYGLTGGTGSGKSLVASELKRHGITVLDADAIYSELTTAGSKLLDRISEAFGSQVINEDGSLNRKKLAEIAFSSEANTKKLNSITHGAVCEEMEKRSRGESLVFCDVPLIYETHTENLYDEIWLVVAPLELRISRIIERDNLTRAEALARISRQLNDNEKIAKADIVIINDSTQDILIEKVDLLIKERLKL